MALSATDVALLNGICYGFNKTQLGTQIAALQSGVDLPYGLVGAMAATGVAGANAVGTATTAARVDHVHKMTPASVITALATAATAVAFNSQKLSSVADGVAVTDAATKGQLDLVSGAVTAMVKRTVTLTHADFVGVLANDSAAMPIGAILPANARLFGIELILNAAFTDGAGCTATVDIGGSDANSLVEVESMVAGVSGNYPLGLSPLSGIAGAGRITTPGVKCYPGAAYSGQQLTATFHSNVNLDLWTAGSITINVFYVVLP